MNLYLRKDDQTFSIVKKQELYCRKAVEIHPWPFCIEKGGDSIAVKRHRGTMCSFLLEDIQRKEVNIWIPV